MSFILGYVNMGNALIMSDGRAGHPGSYDEFHDKTNRINDKIIVGSCGYAEECNFIIDWIGRNAGDNIANYNLDDYINEFIDIFKTKPKETSCKSTFVTLGIDCDGNMCTSILGHTTDLQPQKNICEGIRYCAAGGTIEGKLINEIYIRNLFYTDVSIFDRLKNTVIEVSKLDPSVNSNCYYQCIGSLKQLDYPDPRNLL